MDGFEADYKKHYKVVRDVLIKERTTGPGLSLFSDNKACTECKNSGRKACDDETVLRINSKLPLLIINIEEFFTQFDGNTLSSVKDKCDLMLYDKEHNRLAFSEMSCTQEKYVKPYDNSRGHNNGKRAKAFRQLCASIAKLMDVPEIAAKICAYNNKCALFAVRLKDAPVVKTSPLATMQKFSNFVRSIQNGAILNMGNGFTFEVVQYPTIISGRIQCYRSDRF